MAVNVSDLTTMLTIINKNTDNVNKNNQGGSIMFQKNDWK